MIMRKSLSLLSTSLVLAASGLMAQAAVAQTTVAPTTAAGARIGFVNTDRLFSETKVAQKAQAKLKAEFSTRENTLQAQGDRLKKAIEDFDRTARTMSEKQRMQRQQQLFEQDADFQQKRRQFQDDLNNRKNDELQQLIDRANQVIIRVARQSNIDAIFQEAVYVNPQIDITDEVIKGLDATAQ